MSVMKFLGELLKFRGRPDPKGRRICFDIEATNLLNAESIDYSQAPFARRASFVIHCIAAVDIDTQERWDWVQGDCVNFRTFLQQEKIRSIIGHNIINYDLLALKVLIGLEYDVLGGTLEGQPVHFVDTLVLSKTLNPDRRGHSIGYFGELLGLEKIDWRAKALELRLIEPRAPRGAEFQTYHPEMLAYNHRDVDVNVKVFHHLMREWGVWDWMDAFVLETIVADIITRQSHRGFWFDQQLAVENVRELDKLMEEARVIVEPHIPPKKPTQADMKAFQPPKIQLKKDGTLSAQIVKWVEKHGGKAYEEDENLPARIEVFGKTHRLPMPTESLLTEVPAKIDDTTHIKGWFVEMGWQPTAWKERDLTVDSKKQKLSTVPEGDKPSKFQQTVERYIEQTMDSPFCWYRMERLKDVIRPFKKLPVQWLIDNPYAVRDALLEMGTEKGIKVFTNPQISVGQDKELCPALERIQDRFAYTKDITNYLTYKHRRNSILGGGFDPDEDEEPDKGFLAKMRDDGRIATPADSCGCNTSRMKHREVANIPRVSSLFGGNMRAMFGVDGMMVQMGYDGSSLEARIEAHYCWPHEGKDKAYCLSLPMEKPNDVHTMTAKRIGELLGSTFLRDHAKSVKYCLAYGGQIPKVAKIVGCTEAQAKEIFNAYWEVAKPLAKLKDALVEEWMSETNMKRFIRGIDGRKIPTRSKHALINAAFQSAGVICMKLAMVIHEIKLREKGMTVDFWKDDWKNASYAQQLIAYHDEGQFEITPDLVKWKSFATEEAAKDFLKANKGWYGVKEAKGRFFCGYSEVGELAVQAVEEAGKIYKLNVPLGAEYALGRNWRDCH